MSPRSTTKITLPLLGTVEGVPRSTVAIIALLAAFVTVYIAWYKAVRQPELQLVTAQEATEAAQAEIVEYGKHIGESPVSEATLDGEPWMYVKRYKDRCTLLVSDSPDGLRSQLVRDITRGKLPALSGRTAGLAPFVATVEAAGQCLNPHAGTFKSWYGAKQGCWVPVWRQWADGCTHTQMFDACNGRWDERIQWTVCNH